MKIVTVSLRSFYFDFSLDNEFYYEESIRD